MDVSISYIKYLITGFHPKNTVFESPHDDFEGQEMNIVMTNDSLPFSKVYTYPNKSLIRTGADYQAALYFKRALNFKFK